MHLHHELQRALADTKFDAAGMPRPEARTDNQTHRSDAAADARSFRLAFWHRRGARDHRTTGTLRAGQH